MAKKNYNLRKNRGPYNKSTGRDYERENENYKSKPEQIKKRSERNAARKKMIDAGRAKVGDGKDVAHKNNRTSDNNLSNLTLQKRSANRAEPRKRRTRKN
jgi:hypothetical protein